MTSDYWFIVAAVVLIVVGGVFAAVDTAVSTVSNARVDDMVREGRAGARRLAGILEARATYVGLVVLLRVVCEAAPGRSGGRATPPRPCWPRPRRSRSSRSPRRS